MATKTRSKGCRFCQPHDLHDPRMVFNGGFWDGDSDIRNHRPDRTRGQGFPLPKDCPANCRNPSCQGHHSHNNAYYRAGYRLGVRYALGGWQGESSTPAWDDLHATTTYERQALMA